MKKKADSILKPLDIQEGEDVFISYSRKDEDFVRWLNESFRGHGRKPWIDWIGIAPGEEWWPSILRGIDAANAFLFVLSPDSVQAKVPCQEIDHAVTSGKRIVPVVCRNIEGLKVHQALAERNYIFLRTDEEQAKNLSNVFEALDTDLDHVRAHTKFLIRAREWESRGTSSAYLLRGGLLHEADLWLAQVGGKLPTPTELHSRYILASRAAARRSQRITTSAIMGGLVVALGLAAVASVQRREAEAQTRFARIQAGKGHMLRAKLSEKSSNCVFYAARAMGFAGLGKLDTRENEPSWLSPRRLKIDTQAAWNQITGRSGYSTAGQEEFPILFAGQVAAKEAAVAYQTVDLSPGLPFLWSSTVGSQLSGPFFIAAFSPDGQTVISAEAKTIKLWDVATGKERASLSGHSSWGNSVAFSPDGRTLASGWEDKTVKLWDVSTGKENATLSGHSSLVRSVAFSPDGRTLASGSQDMTVKLWDVSTGKENATLSGHSSLVRSVAFSPDGRILASSSEDKTVKLWDVGSGKENATLSGHLSWVESVAFSPDGQILAGDLFPNTVKLWEVSTGKENATLSGHSSTFSPDGQTMVGVEAKTVKLWDVASGKEKYTLQGHLGDVRSVDFSPDGQTLATASLDNTVKIWDVSTGKEKATLNGHSDWVTCIGFSPDGQTLVSASRDKTVRLWGVVNGKQKVTLHGHFSLVRSVAFSPDGRTLASGGDITVKLWDLASDQEKASLKGHSQEIRSVAFSPDGQALASASFDNTVKIWEVATGNVKATLRGHSSVVRTSWSEHSPGSVYSVAFSPDGQMLASGAFDNTVILWEVDSGNWESTLNGHSREIHSVVFSPDGRTLASGSEDNTVKLWEVTGGKEKATLSGHTSAVFSVAFSPDGQTLASASQDNTVKLWEVASGKEKATLSGHTGAVFSVAFSPDGQTLASGSEDNTVKIWEVAGGKEKATLNGHSDWVMSVAFSPDGQYLASGSRDNTVKLWEMTDLVRADLFVYLEKGWCHFDPETEELVWSDPPQSIETPFRNVLRHSSLGILRRTDLSQEDKNWLLYLKVLEAENWDSAAIFYGRLTAEQKQFPHCNVIWAIRTLAEQAKKAQEVGLPVLAELRLASARKFQAELPAERLVEIPEVSAAEAGPTNAKIPTPKAGAGTEPVGK